jgi:hypothetical protein
LPTDTGCLLNNTATWIASQIQAAFQPLADQILTNPADIVYQTPLLTDETSPQNRVIQTLNRFLVEVVDLGFASLLVIGGYNVIVGRHLGLQASGLQELLPRAMLVEMGHHPESCVETKKRQRGKTDVFSSSSPSPHPLQWNGKAAEMAQKPPEAFLKGRVYTRSPFAAGCISASSKQCLTVN